MGGSRWFVVSVVLAALVCVLPTFSVAAQDGPADEAPARDLLIRSVRFEGNEHFSDAQLQLRVRTAANRRFLGIPGFTWWRWVYQFGETGVLGRRVSESLKASGEAPAQVDRTVLDADVERLEAFYNQEGYRQAQISASLDTLRSGERVNVIFHIRPGSPTYIRRITYEGLDALTPEQQVRLARGTVLRTWRVDPEQPLVLRGRRQRYSEPTLHEERRRLLAFLRDEGFATVSRDSIRAFIFPQSSGGTEADSFDVRMRIGPGQRYRFGDVRIDVQGPEEAPVRRDSVTIAPVDSVPGGVVRIRIDDETRLQPDLLERALQFRPGQWYDQEAVLATKRRLEGTGLFAFSDITSLPADTTQPPGADAPYLPHRIELRTRSRHLLRFETFMLQRTGVLGTPDAELGTGAGVTYQNANLFGGGESFRLRTSGSIAIDADTRLSTSTQAEISASLTYPYLVAPFGRLDDMLALYDARTRLSLSLLTARRDALRLVIRGRGSARFRLEMQHNPVVTSYVDVLDLSLSNPDTLSGFNERFLDRILDTLDDPVQQAQIKEDYTQPQINNAFRYTLLAANVDPLQRRHGYSYEFSGEVGGNLPYLLDRFVFSPGDVESTLPGLPFFGGGRSTSRLLYRQYVRGAVEARRYHSVGGGATLAWRLTGGVAHPLGTANVVPFERRFYSGGASSVRGWRLRQLGPGGARFVSDSLGAAGDVTNLLGGEIKLEGSVEWRQTMLRNVLAADWMGVGFVDVGNVWFGPRNPGFGEDATTSAPLRTGDGRFQLDEFYTQFGVGTGVGLRIAWDYFIARLDVAVRAYDPARSAEGLFPQELSSPVLHFGIGHAF